MPSFKVTSNAQTGYFKAKVRLAGGNRMFLRQICSIEVYDKKRTAGAVRPVSRPPTPVRPTNRVRALSRSPTPGRPVRPSPMPSVVDLSSDRECDATVPNTEEAEEDPVVEVSFTPSNTVANTYPEEAEETEEVGEDSSRNVSLCSTVILGSNEEESRFEFMRDTPGLRTESPPPPPSPSYSPTDPCICDSEAGGSKDNDIIPKKRHALFKPRAGVKHCTHAWFSWLSSLTMQQETLKNDVEIVFNGVRSLEEPEYLAWIDLSLLCHKRSAKMEQLFTTQDDNFTGQVVVINNGADYMTVLVCIHINPGRLQIALFREFYEASVFLESLSPFNRWPVAVLADMKKSQSYSNREWGSRILMKIGQEYRFERLYLRHVLTCMPQPRGK